MKPDPYSPKGVKQNIYHYLIRNWVGLTNVKHLESGKGFDFLVSDIVESCLKKSDLWVERGLSTKIEFMKNRRMAKYEERSTKSFETISLEKLSKRISEIENEMSYFDIFSFSKEMSKEILIQFSGLEYLHPKKRSTINDDNIKDLLINIRDTKTERLSFFDGFEFKRDETFHFVDAITAPVVFYNMKNDMKEIESLVLGISSYVLKLNECKNTKDLMNKINRIERDGIDYDKIEYGKFNVGKDSKKKKKSEKIGRKDLNNLISNKSD